MNKLMDKNPYLTLGILFTLTIAIAIVGIAAEVVFITNHLEHCNGPQKLDSKKLV